MIDKPKEKEKEMNEMTITRRKWIRIISMAVFAGSLMILAERDGKLDENIQEETASLEEQNIEEETEEAEQECDFEGYQALDVDLFGNEFLDQVIVDRAAEDIGEGKEEFVPVVSENSSFPEGLIFKMEEVLYQAKDSMTRGWWNIDIEMTEEVRSHMRGYGVSGDLYTEFGLKDFRLTSTEELNRLFPKAAPVYYSSRDETYENTYKWIGRYYDIPEDISLMYRMKLLPGKDNYLFESYRAGIHRNRIRLTERVGDEFRTIYEFDRPFSLATGVIQYEDKFYFIAVDKDINVGADCGVTIYRLDYESPGDSMRFLYQPEEYAAENYDTDSAELKPLIESGYMDKVLEDFSSGKYLHEGSQKDGAEIYYGDEEKAFEGEYVCSVNEIYKMDIANCGYPVYLCKDMYLPQEDGEGIKQLRMHFFYYDTELSCFKNLEELSTLAWRDYGHVGYLVQMWFKEMEGKVYTFRVYNLGCYNYLMDIALVEGDKITSVGTYFLWPRKQIVLEERHPEENVVQGDRYFKVTYEGDAKYHYLLYDRKGNVLKKGEGKKQPLIMYIDETTIRLKEYGEEGEWYMVYYDIENDRLSETYLNAVEMGEGKTAYLDDREEDVIVVVKNIFDGDYYEEIPLDLDIEDITNSTGRIEYGRLRIHYKYNERDEYKVWASIDM